MEVTNGAGAGGRRGKRGTFVIVSTIKKEVQIQGEIELGREEHTPVTWEQKRAAKVL